MKALALMALALAIPAATQPVTVEIVSVGHVEVPAGRYIYTGVISATDVTVEAAEARLAKSRKAVIAKVTAKGGTITFGETTQELLDPSDGMTSLDDAADNFSDGMMNNMSAVGNEGDSSLIAVKTKITITMPKAELAWAIYMSSPDGLGLDMNSVETAPADPVAAKRLAKAQGLANARAEAEAYAAKLGLPVITLVAISERTDLGTLFQMSGADGRPPFQRKSTGNPVPIDVPLTVTFRLEPAATP